MSDKTTDAEVVADLASRQAKPTYIGGVPYVITENGQQINRLENILDAPVRNKGHLVCGRVESFIGMVNDRKGDTTQLRANMSDFDGYPSIKAVINGRTKDQPSWEDDAVIYRFQRHEKLAHWSGHSKRPMTCREFALFVENNRADFVQRKDPADDPSTADLIEMARSIRGSSKVEFSEDIDEKTGARGAAYSETIKIKAGKGRDLEIPGHMTIAIPMFEGDLDRVTLVCVLRAAVSEDGKVQFHYNIEDLDEILEMAVNKAVNDISEKVEISPVYYIK